MAKDQDAECLEVPRAFVEFVLLGPVDDQRQLQDSPLLGDVWLAFGEHANARQDLLVTPHRNATGGRVANEIASGLAAVRGKGASEADTPANIAYLQGLVAAKLTFLEVLRVVLPLTMWWHAKTDRVFEKLQAGNQNRALHDCILGIVKSFPKRRSVTPARSVHYDAYERFITLCGLMIWAAKQPPLSDGPTVLVRAAAVDEVINSITSDIDEIVDSLLEVFDEIKKDCDSGWASKFFKQSKGGKTDRAGGRQTIFQVSLNRRALSALDKSVPAVKADAARTLFNVNCERITWAVVDSGIDRTHTAFQSENESRVRRTFDFTRIRDIVSRDPIDDDRLERLITNTKLTKAQAKRHLKTLANDAENERPLNWDLVERFVSLEKPDPPKGFHGTHVAGIIGAKKSEVAGELTGMCPDIQLYDFRVLDKTIDDTEFAIIAALQFIRYLNSQHNYITIHGANLSLSIPHDVRNYACGLTPICDECERVVDSGVVVVAAAGNRGYQHFETQDGLFESYAAFSVTDPGNSDGVITVGSTHRNWPHTYGVSFFSSRGPTGDGRMKPDLVAPGERIRGPVPNNEWASESGTSMATPHVSGAAAMLMARYVELIGQPRRIKSILCESATDLGRERSFQGHGMLDVLRAFQSI